jgi:hypothetical protein
MSMPTFVLAGAPKAGTNNLLSALASHPQVFVPDVKEPMFFFWHGCDVEYRFFGAPPIAHPYHRDLAAYQRMLDRGRIDLAIGEGSVHYLASERATRNLASLVPDVRVLVLLRDPVERALSHHRFNVARGVDSRPFDEAVEAELADEDPDTLYPSYRYVGNGAYGRHIARYLEVFPAEQVRVLLFEDLVARPAELVEEAEEFIGVPVGRSTPEAAYRNETVEGGALASGIRRIRSSSGPVGGVARRVERMAGSSRAYQVVKQRAKVAARRSSRAHPVEAPAADDATRALIADRLRADTQHLAQLCSLDLSGWATSPTAGPAVTA